MKKSAKPKPRKKKEAKETLVAVELFSTTGKKMAQRLLRYPDPRKAVQNLSRQDFFRLVKKADEESLALLALGTEDQWQYLFDIDLWDKDRIDPKSCTLWMERFGAADPERFVTWLLRDGLHLAFLYFYEALEIITVTPDDEYPEIPDGFYTFDGVVYIRSRDEEAFEAVRTIMETLVRVDRDLYGWFLQNLGGIIPSETEEEAYRFRNARLADEGFLTFDEACEVYTPLDPASLDTFKIIQFQDVEDDDQGPIFRPPRLPLSQIGATTFLAEVIDRITDFPTLDRLCIEFAGLCNQVVSADGLAGRELADMADAGAAAEGYINLALEELARHEFEAAEQVIRAHPLQAIFRVGFGMVQACARETERWIETSWFRQRGLSLSFWGEPEGKLIRGLVARRPRLHVRGEEYRHFEAVDDLELCRQALSRLALMDRLFSRLHRSGLIDEHLLDASDMTFRPILITFFARKLIAGEAGASLVSLPEARAFLDLLRKGDRNPPYVMHRYEKEFISCFAELPPAGIPSEDQTIIGDFLAAVWRDFREEYENVESTDLSPRYSRLLIIEGTKRAGR